MAWNLTGVQRFSKLITGSNVIGAVLLNEFYKIQAQPFVGIAAYCVSTEPKSVLVFADENMDYSVPTDRGFHCWIETDDWIIDFSTPLFPMIARERNFPTPGCKMMQCKRSRAKKALNDLLVTGDFFLDRSAEFTEFTLKKFAAVPLHQDVIEICRQWFVMPPKQMHPKLTLCNQDGEHSCVAFSRFDINGSW
ncbi:DUF2026 family protein [Prosthecobacter vanneervenii]|uniref:Uncharacterized protein n=1 Tax=Prosthecobacter vanneervenii TaxID=48466 RepID=A0A7W7YBZ1_9BACT|nr:DUF2026 family protein [Prosthecobacter vanneervenii]MBB5033207.1 hypothetical protein [Prosthecobacter vanneervenii]